MRKIKIIFFLLSIIISANVFSQTVTIAGKAVLSDTKDCRIPMRLFDAGYKLLSAQLTEKDGSFAFNKDIHLKENYFVVASYIGYNSDTLRITANKETTNIGTISLSPIVQQLKEVTVSTSSRIVKNGIASFFPTEQQRKESIDGITLLSKLNIPRLLVNEFANSIQLIGSGSVVTCINGRIVSTMEIMALSPKNIKRVEYHNLPEAKYNNADAVLDFIVTNDRAGGNVYASLWEGRQFSEDELMAKVNRGKSQCTLYNNFQYRRWKEHYRSNEEEYHFTDKVLSRSEDGHNDLFRYNNNDIMAMYNYQNGNQIFNVYFDYTTNHAPHNDWNSTLLYSDRTDKIEMHDKNYNYSKSPSARIYYRQPVGKTGTLILNLIGQYNDNTFKRDYSELSEADSYNLLTRVSETQYGDFISATFDRKLWKGTWSSGLKYNSSLSMSNYSNDINSQTESYDNNLHRHSLYIYSQYSHPINKNLSSRIAFGFSKEWNKSGAIGQQNFIWRPTFSISYNKNDFDLQYLTSIWSNSPSLSDLMSHTQTVDYLQKKRGDTNLKYENLYYNLLMLGYYPKRAIFAVSLSQLLIKNVLMESTYLDNNSIVRAMENQPNWQNYEANFNISNWFFNNHLLLSTFFGIKHIISNGEDYHHTRNIYYYGGEVRVNLKNWSFNWFCNYHSSDKFRGETMTKRSEGHMFTLAYSTNKYRISLDGVNLFTKDYLNAKVNYSAIAPYRRYEYLGECKNLIRFRVVINLNFGKKYEEAERNAENSSISSSILKGEK